MVNNNRFSISVHILLLIAHYNVELTGDQMAASVNTNPVVIRKITGLLKKAGILDVRAGIGGAYLLKRPEEINLLDIYRAVNEIDEKALYLFNVHQKPNASCQIGRNIENVLKSELLEVQSVMEARLAEKTLADLITKF